MSRTDPTITVEQAREEALALLGGVDEGEGLDVKTAALIALGVHAAVTTLASEAITIWAERALDAGATLEQVHETLLVVSGLGVHTLMEGTSRVTALARARGLGTGTLDGPLDPARLALRNSRQGDHPYWQDFNRETPGFLDDLLRMSPEAYAAFFDYCAVPWRTRALRGQVKELLALACDATPAHRYLPGLRLHARNAIALGAGRRSVLETLDIAAAAPTHRGVAAARNPETQYPNQHRRPSTMSDTVYRVTEIVGSATDTLEEAINGAVRRASENLRNVNWFEVSEIRGHVEDGKVAHFQVTLKVGFAIEDTKS